LQATEEVCGRTKRLTRHSVTWWWNQDVAKLVEGKRSRFKIWSQTGSEIDRAAYCTPERLQVKRFTKLRRQSERGLELNSAKKI